MCDVTNPSKSLKNKTNKNNKPNIPLTLRGVLAVLFPVYLRQRQMYMTSEPGNQSKHPTNKSGSIWTESLRHFIFYLFAMSSDKFQFPNLTTDEAVANCKSMFGSQVALTADDLLRPQVWCVLKFFMETTATSKITSTSWEFVSPVDEFSVSSYSSWKAISEDCLLSKLANSWV